MATKLLYKKIVWDGLFILWTLSMALLFFYWKLVCLKENHLDER